MWSFAFFASMRRPPLAMRDHHLGLVVIVGGLRRVVHVAAARHQRVRGSSGRRTAARGRRRPSPSGARRSCGRRRRCAAPGKCRRSQRSAAPAGSTGKSREPFGPREKADSSPCPTARAPGFRAACSAAPCRWRCAAARPPRAPTSAACGAAASARRPLRPRALRRGGVAARRDEQRQPLQAVGVVHRHAGGFARPPASRAAASSSSPGCTHCPATLISSSERPWWM